MKTKLFKLLTASILLMGGVEAVNATKIKFVDDEKLLKSTPGQKGQLALVKINNVIVKYIYDGKVWLPMQDALELNVKRSCKEIKIANPYAKSGYYTIDPDGPGGGASFKVYCEMETDGGGWTEVFLAKTNNYNSTRIDYTTKNAKDIINNAKEMMFAFVNPKTHTYQNQWKFSPIPETFKTTTPMTRGNDTAGSGYATINATDAIYKTTKNNF